ncbi:MAG TPA: hemopexin repeat-containing protein [Trebonia sp.]
MGTGVYFFSGDEYVRYDRGDDAVSDGPLSIADNWHGMADAEFDAGIDAAINLQAGNVYFFQGDQYVRYNLSQDRVDFGPTAIGAQWPGMAAAGFDSDLDAALNWGDGTAYFFKRDSYVRYRLAAPEGVEAGYPLKIAAQWPGMAAAGFDSDLDGAIAWGDGSVFFFRGDEYVRFDIADNTVPSDYPLSIAERWPGMDDAGFSASAIAAVDTYDLASDDSVWLPTAVRRPPAVNGPTFIALPWRGVLHTTEGDTLSGALGTLDANRSWPNLTIDPDRLSITQHYPLSRGARALTDHGTPQNAARAIQIEIVGHAGESPNWAPERLAFILDVMRQIEAVVPISRTTNRNFLDLAGVSSTPSNRMSIDEWKRFSGWCGHQHVPGNTHWDPGAIDIQTLLTA